MVHVTNPRLGETVLDPAAGMGGFLVEAYNHLSIQVKTVSDRKVLQERIFSAANRSRCLLCQMNLLLTFVWPELAEASTGTNVRRRKLNPADFLEYQSERLGNPP